MTSMTIALQNTVILTTSVFCRRSITLLSILHWLLLLTFRSITKFITWHFYVFDIILLFGKALNHCFHFMSECVQNSCITFCSTTDGGTYTKPGFLCTVSPITSLLSKEIRLSFTPSFPIAWTFLTQARLRVHQGTQFLLSELFENHAAHMTDQWFTHVASLLLTLERNTRPTAHARGRNNDRIKRSDAGPQRPGVEQQTSENQSPNPLFFLKYSVFPPKWTCIHGQDSNLHSAPLPDFSQDFWINNSSDCVRCITCPWNSSHFPSMIVDQSRAQAISF